LARALRVLTRSPRLSGAGQALPGAVDRAGAPGAPLRKRATAQCLGGSADLGRRARSTEFGAHLRSGGSRGMGQDGRSAVLVAPGVRDGVAQMSVGGAADVLPVAHGAARRAPGRPRLRWF